jgi:hypothetical protein
MLLGPRRRNNNNWKMACLCFMIIFLDLFLDEYNHFDLKTKNSPVRKQMVRLMRFSSTTTLLRTQVFP